MADETDSQPVSKKRSPVALTAAIVLVVAVVEGGAFFALVKFFGGGPDASYGSENESLLEESSPAEQDESVTEVVLLERFRVPNTKTGHTIMYDFDISVVVPTARKEEMDEIVQSRYATIKDRVTIVIRQAPPRVLNEDNLATLRRLLKQGLNEVIGDDEMIRRVLIPRCVPLQTG